MNTNSDSLSTIDSRFDRLVDGELSEAERRELLTGLDQEPGGWRRCALAFLESQCWKESAGQVANLPPQSTPVGQVVNLPSRAWQSSWHGRMATVLAMAASFVAALWLGSWAQRAWHGVPAGLIGNDQVASTGRPVAWPGGQAGSPTGVPSQDNFASNPWRVVTVSSPGNGQEPGRSIRLPAVERDRIDEQWLRSMPPAIPDEVLQALSRTGHQVQQRRELLPLPLQDGRKLVVPVDQVEVKYIGNQAY